MISSIAGAQPPQLILAAHADTTSLRVRAPLRTALRITRSVTARQWQTITSDPSISGGRERLPPPLDVIDRTILKMKFKIIFDSMKNPSNSKSLIFSITCRISREMDSPWEMIFFTPDGF